MDRLSLSFFKTVPRLYAYNSNRIVITMAEQNVRITIAAEDKASGPLKNVGSALGDLQKETSKAAGVMSSLGRAAETAGGMIVAKYGMAAVSAVQRLTKEMINLSVEQSRFVSQTQSLFRNTGLQAYVKDVESVISKHEAMTSFKDNEIRQSLNILISSTRDYKKSLEILSLAEDLAAAKGIDLVSATNMINQALEGSYTQLKKQGVMLDETKLKTLDAANQYLYLKQSIEQAFGGSSEALRQSAAGVFQNYKNQIDNLKEAFGSEMLESISPALDSVANKISTLFETGKIQPLITSFGNLFSEIWDCGSALGTLTMKLTGMTNEEDAINSIANAFDRVSVMVKAVNSALERMQTLISTLHLDKIIDFGMRAMNPGGMALWDYAGWQVDLEKASQMTPHERSVRAALKSSPTTGGVVSGVFPGEETSADMLGRLREIQRAENENKEKKKDNSLAVQNNTQNMQTATELLKLYKDQTSQTGTEIVQLGQTAGSAIGYMNSAMDSVRQMLSASGGGGGKGGCRTFKSGTYTTDGHNESYSSGGGPSSSPGMAWYNVLGNENAGVVAAMGQEWASTVTNVVRNSCSGKVCSFEADGQKFYGDGGGGYSSVNDALITSKGDVIQFHPDDNILAFKDGSKVGGKNVTIHNTFNISGNGDPDRIAEEIMKKITRIGRIGF